MGRMPARVHGSVSERLGKGLGLFSPPRWGPAEQARAWGEVRRHECRHENVARQAMARLRLVSVHAELPHFSI
jgi:hypothetical protein